MAIKKYNFDFKELTLDLPGLQAILGYPESPLPAPFDDYLLEALDFASQLTDIKACSRIIEDFQFEPSKGRLVADGRAFLVGKTVLKELRNSEELLFFVCTAGKAISEKSALLLMGDDPAKGYIYDQVGIFLTEAAGDRMQQLIQEELRPGQKATNRYSPGYCHWDVSDQHHLFALFPLAPCGVTLTHSALMNPVKSISGVIGIGKEVSYRDYPCALCLSLNCIYRRVKP
ncbi:MAG: methionine synthase [Bacteroidia bacterium]|nr:methionine synthase [Bacteroidia bacterium]